MRTILKTIVITCVISGLFFLLSQSQVFAACGEIRSQGGIQFCDYNGNGSQDPGERSFVNCSGSACCSSGSECPGASTAGCEPGSGFIPLGDCLKLSDDSNMNQTYTTPAFLVNLLVRNLFVAAGVIFFFMFLIAGFQFITGGKKGLDSAKQIATAALIGFLLMFAAYWIVQIVAVLTRTDIPI